MRQTCRYHFHWHLGLCWRDWSFNNGHFNVPGKWNLVSVRVFCNRHLFLIRAGGDSYAVFSLQFFWDGFAILKLKNHWKELGYFLSFGGNWKRNKSATGMSNAEANSCTVDIVGLLTPLSILAIWEYSISASKANCIIVSPFFMRIFRRFSPKAFKYAVLRVLFTLAMWHKSHILRMAYIPYSQLNSQLKLLLWNDYYAFLLYYF